MAEPFINRFKQELIGGGARSNLFRCQGLFPAEAVAVAGLNPSSQIQFLCNAASIPPITITPITTNFLGRPMRLAGERDFPEWNIQVLNDTNWALRNAFEKWSDIISTIESHKGRGSLAQYAFQWQVTQLDRDGSDLKTYKFVDCWPSAITAIDLNFEPATSVEQFGVTIQYQYYTSDSGVSS